jgi:hypothetical protein
MCVANPAQMSYEELVQSASKDYLDWFILTKARH